jgi:general secretion pathway protein I
LQGRRQRTPCHGTRNRSSGFALLEVLVALVIVGLAMTAILELFSSNLRNVAASEDYVRASVKAETRLREILDGVDLAEHRWSEVTNDGYRVDVAVEPVHKDRAEIAALTLLRVDLTISWWQGIRQRSVRLQTLKLVRPSGVNEKEST